MVRAHVTAYALEELGLASRTVFLGHRVRVQVDVVHNQARTAGPLLEILELWQLLKLIRIN